MFISQSFLSTLFSQAKASPRLRQNYDLRNSEADNSQRMLNALEPGTVMPIHRHRKTSESICMVRGKMVMRLYDDKGNVTDEFVMKPCGEHPMVQVEKGQWHLLEVLDGRIREPNLNLSKGGEVWRVGAAWKRRAN